MKLLSQSFDKDSSGVVVLVPEDKEDLWAVYNLIAKDDEVQLTTVRYVKKPGKESSKAKQEKKIVNLRIQVENVDFSPIDEIMRIKGRTRTQNDDVPLNSYHTAELQYNHKFSLFKSDWDQVAYDIITKSCSVEEKAELGAVVLQEGVAHICLITDSLTVLRAKVEKSIPKKRRGDNSAYDKAYTKFLDSTIDTMLRNLDYVKLKAIVLASPGFVADNLLSKLFQKAAKDNNKDLLAAKSKFIVTHSSTGYLQGLEEAFHNPELQKKLSDTKYAREISVLDDFFKILNLDDGRAWYGPDECDKALEIGGAIRHLLLTDSLFRSDSISQRKKYIQIAETVKAQGGDVSILSSLHDSGKQLDELTGVAVILNYPILDLDE
ncbi:BA75_02422T0 [Komagataella pastoris]|uniref:Protein DOM34 homolog n=1 Tax=Komagataella pastoris TaxID=4922 RepID=A0A1B2JDT9_PICPA|nr:BA75_02422T0 [Komagataella pastoris]